MEKELIQFKEKAQKVVLTPLEKEHGHAGLVAFMHAHPAPIRSPWTKFVPNKLFVTTFAALVVMFTGFSVYAERAIPGDAHYWFKTRINEPIITVLAFSEHGRAKSDIFFTERRFEEMKILLNEDVQNKEYIQDLAEEVNERSNRIATFIDAAAEEGEVDQSIETAVRFNLVLEMNEQIIDNTANSEIEKNSIGEVERVIHTHRNRVDAFLKREIKQLGKVHPETELLTNINESRLKAKEVVRELQNSEDIQDETKMFAELLLKQADEDVRSSNYVSAYIRYAQIVAIGSEKEVLSDNEDIVVTDDVLALEETPVDTGTTSASSMLSD